MCSLMLRYSSMIRLSRIGVACWNLRSASCCQLEKEQIAEFVGLGSAKVLMQSLGGLQGKVLNFFPLAQDLIGLLKDRSNYSKINDVLLDIGDCGASPCIRH